MSAQIRRATIGLGIAAVLAVAAWLLWIDARGLAEAVAFTAAAAGFASLVLLVTELRR